MSEIVIKVENVSKQYRLGSVGTGTLSHDLNRMWARIRGKEDPFSKLGDVNDRTTKGNSDFVWSLKDINFEVKHGEVLGIIGRNGAGKSTLLKILSRTTSPTTGSIKIKGRVASLLEVGTGFHPELTGRENIFLNGAILGMTKGEINRKFDEIVDFSGVERYIDTPVKRYSSGMYVRLAFAVAANLEQEILIVDEVLAVGDAEFQKKCIGKMKSVSVNEGRTVLFVSHNMDAIVSLTNHSLFLKKGMLQNYGPTQDIIKEYISVSNSGDLKYFNDNISKKACIKSVELKTSLPNNIQIHGSHMEVHIQLFTPQPISSATFSFQILDAIGNPFVHMWIHDIDQNFCRESGTYNLVCIIPDLRLYMGNYSLKCHYCGPRTSDMIEIVEGICPFEVVMYNTTRSLFPWAPGACVYLEKGSWTITKNS